MVETSPAAPAAGRFHHYRQRLDVWRCVPAFVSSHRTLFAALWVAAFFSVFVWQRNIIHGFSFFGGAARSLPSKPLPRTRPIAFNLTDFGAVGDGVTVNTKAFERAVLAISKLGKRGGAQLNVPSGRWLTGPFNLTSHMTLFLAEDAEILAIQVGFSSSVLSSWVLLYYVCSFVFGSIIHYDIGCVLEVEIIEEMVF